MTNETKTAIVQTHRSIAPRTMASHVIVHVHVHVHEEVYNKNVTNGTTPVDLGLTPTHPP